MAKCSVKFDAQQVIGVDIKNNVFQCQFEAISDGKCILHDKNPNKSITDFDEAVKHKIRSNDWLYNYTVFPKGIECRFGKISGPANFEHCKFYSTIHFNSTVFTGDASFRRAEFFEDAEFTGIPVRGKRTTFIGTTNFYDAVFHKSAFFQNCEFREVNWDGCIFKGFTNFSQSRFDKTPIFNNVQFIGRTVFDCEIGASSSITLSYCKMDGILFWSLPLALNVVNIIKPKSWYTKGRFLEPKRSKVIDEIENPEDYVKLQFIYRWLESYFYDKTDFGFSPNFYHGLMRCRRFDKPHTSAIARFSNLLYEYFSRYGHSTNRPLFGIIGMWLIMPFILLQLGSFVPTNGHLKGEKGVTYRTYDLKFASTSQDPWQYAKDYGSLLIGNVAFSTIDRNSPLAPKSGTLQQLLVLFESLMLVIFVAFLIIALRRQYTPKKPTGT